ncbi:MAG TPA: TatD family hydrolase [Anaerolineales bacterium]|nr:TatD family hydrolase [Anaerolineales bacterium]
MLTDTHCHLDSEAFDADRAAVIQRAVDAGIERILVPALDLRSSRRCIEIAGEYPPVFVAVGIHPTEIKPEDVRSIDVLRELAKQPKVQAIGEIGLDYYWVQDPDEQALQRDVLRQQLAVAAELNKPVVLHCRERGDAASGPCSDDLIAILEAWVETRAEAGIPGVLHSFSSSLEIAQRAIALGFYIGVTGPVTYKNAEARRRIIAALPLERLLIETDAPYLSPEPHRGHRNEPAYVAYIADKIAGVQSSTTDHIAAVTGDNAAQMLSWRDAA